MESFPSRMIGKQSLGQVPIQQDDQMKAFATPEG